MSWNATLLLAGVVAATAAGGWYVHDTPIRRAKEKVAESLNDPGSAQWRNVRKVGRRGVCGEVNAKNRMGGYVGFRAFYALVLDDSVVGMFDASTEDLASLDPELRQLAMRAREHIEASCK